MNDESVEEVREPSDRKAPGFWFYPADYERDMQLLPMAAQGLWMRMLCWMSENEMHRGFLELPTGAPMTPQDIARRAGTSLKETQRLLACMERIGTFSKDQRGCLISRRMARDTHISEARRAAAIKRLQTVERAKTGEFKSPDKEHPPLGGTPKDNQLSGKGQNESINQECPIESPKQENLLDDLHQQIPSKTPSVTASVSVSDYTLTPPTPSNGNGHRKPSGPVTLPSVAREIHSRHPDRRRDCSASAVEKKLAVILKHKRVPVADADGYLAQINRNHEGACRSPDWRKEDGQFARSLENWLAPTKERYEVQIETRPSGPPEHAIIK